MSFLIASGHVEVEARTDKAKSQITALIGAMGAAGPVAGVLAAGMASAGAGIAAFGVAAGKQVAALKKASEAQGKYQDAVSTSGKGSQEAAKAQLEYQRMIAKMPKATQGASAAFSSLKDSYDEWSDSLAGDTMPVFTKSFQLFQALLPKTSGLVRGTSAELDRMVTLLAGGMASPGFDRFMGKLEDVSAATLHAMTDGIIDLSQSLGSFAAGGGFDGFVETAKEVGPLLGETLGNVAEALLNLTTAGGDLGISMLTAANALAELVNAVPPELISTFLQLYAAFKLAKIGAAALAAVTTSSAAAGLAAFTRAARFGGVGPAIAGVTQRMSMLQKVGGSLGVLGIAAIAIDQLAEASRGAPPDVDRLTSSLKTLAASGKWTGELKATFGDMDGFVAKLAKLKTESAGMEKAKPFLAFTGVGAIAEAAVPKIDDLVRGSKSLSATKEDFESFDQALAGMATNGYANQAAEDFRDMKAAWVGSGRSLKEFNSVFPEYRSAVAGLKAEQELAAAGMGVFGQQALETKAKLDAQKGAADGLRASIIALNETNQSAYGAQIQFEAALDSLTASFKEHGATLNTDTEAGRANGQAMLEAAKSQDTLIATGLAAGESFESMTGKSEKLRASMMTLATQAFDGNKKKAQEYVNTLLGTPSEVKSAIKLERQEAITGLKDVQAAITKTPGAKSIKVDTLNGAAIKALEEVGYKTRTLKDGSTQVTTKNGQAIGSIDAVRRAMDAINGKTSNTYTTHNVKTVYSAQYDSNMARPFSRASGGPIRLAGGGNPGGRIAGPGTSTSDSIPAMLSDGEWVIRASAVAKYGDAFMAAINTGRFQPAGFAKGGKLSDKQKAAIAAEKQRQKEGRSALTSDVTFTTGGKLAGYKNTETVHDLGMPDSVGSLVSSINSYLSNIKKAFTGSTEKRLVSQLTSSGKALLDNQKKLEGVNKSLDSAKSTLNDLKGKFDSLKTSVSSSLVGFANVTKIGKYGTSTDTLIKQLSSDAGRTTEFAKQLEALKGKGLNGSVLSDIAGAGITGGGMATAQSLLNASPAQIAKINELQAQLQKSADAAGATTANAMYGAGIKSAEGLVKGLTSQQDKIEAAMMKIAKSMEAAIKKALGIKSPAKRLEPIGDFSAQGVEVGWEKRLAKGRTVLSGNMAGLRVQPGLAPGATAGAAPAAEPTQNITINLTTSFNSKVPPGPRERRQFIKEYVKEINDELRNYQRERRGGSWNRY